MKKMILPDEIKQNLLEIDVWSLKKQGIKAIICDVDNTLCPHDENELSETRKKWIHDVQKEMLLILISNNHGSRIKKLAAELHCPSYEFALKPMKHTYQKILSDYDLKREEVVCIGDQLFTDIIGAKRMKMRNIYVKPISKSDIIYTKLSRKIENWILRGEKI